MSVQKLDNNSFKSDSGQQQIAIVTQLIKIVPNMYSIDELLQWLAYAIVENFDLQLAQFWTPFINTSGSPSTHLRMMVARNPSLPEHVITDGSMILVAKRFAQEQRIIPAQVVDVLFPPYQAAQLKHYGLNFCTGGFMSSHVLLPLPGNNFAQAYGPAPFSLTALFFLSQRAHRDMMPTIGTILKHAVELATNRHLLWPIQVPPTETVTSSQQGPIPPPLAALIPHRKEGGHLMVSDNPFSSSAFIPDKQALRLHIAIDGKKSIAKLCRSTNMDMNSISTALQTLLKLHRIELLDAEGQIMNAALFFPESEL
jgi:hypothetical protein